MTLRHLQIFKSVCDCGSMTEAAAAMNMTQPSVSIAIGELEDYYETKLFERANRRIYLTEEGTALRGYADSILSQIQEANTFIRSKANFNRVRLGVDVPFSESFLTDVVRKIRSIDPNIDLQITVKHSEQIDKLLAENQLDLGLYEGVQYTEGREVTRVGNDVLCVFATDKIWPKNVITLEELSKLPLCINDKGSSIRSLADSVFAKAGLVPNIVMESSTSFALLQMAEVGYGAALLSEASIARVSREHGMHRIDVVDVKADRPMWLVYQNSKHITETMQRVIDIIRDGAVEN